VIILNRQKEARCVILSGGIMEDYDFHKGIVENAEMVICADGGGRYAQRLGIIPNLVLGDLDTITQVEIEDLKSKGVEFVKYPKEKDYTDTHIALLKALELGYKRIDMLACLGGRFDHALANVMLLALPEARELDIRIIDPFQEIFLIKAEMNIMGKKGETISLLPLSNIVSGISSSGLSYTVPGGTFRMGIPNGVSNVFSEDKAKITVEKGLLLGIRVKKEH
jgi:thiamine pyrophosphokinase